MALSLVPPGTGCVPGQWLLLIASLLTFWNVPTTAQLTLEAVPPYVAEGQDVLLRAHNLGENVRSYFWYKRSPVSEGHWIALYKVTQTSTKTGAAYSGRETIYCNGSLLLQNLTQQDMGLYTLRIVTAESHTERATVQFQVYKHVTQPSIQAISATITENDTVTLTCHTEEGHTAISIRWLFNDENLRLTDRMKLFRNNSVLTIDPFRRSDAGEYQCEVSNPVSASMSDPLRLAVISSEDPSGLPVGTVVGIVTGVLAGVGLMATLCCLLFLTRTSRSSIRDDLREPQSPGGGHLGHSVSKAPIAGLESDVPVYEELLKPDENIYDRIIHTTDVASSCPPGSAA